jgi:AmiR/NasT family two-component response regulator
MPRAGPWGSAPLPWRSPVLNGGRSTGRICPLWDTLAEQLQTALNSRVVIEPAKGVVAERRHLDMDQSFTLLRSTARTNNRRLSDLARAVVDGSETL